MKNQKKRKFWRLRSDSKVERNLQTSGKCTSKLQCAYNSLIALEIRSFEIVLNQIDLHTILSLSLSFFFQTKMNGYFLLPQKEIDTDFTKQAESKHSFC